MNMDVMMSIASDPEQKDDSGSSKDEFKMTQYEGGDNQQILLSRKETLMNLRAT